MGSSNWNTSSAPVGYAVTVGTVNQMACPSNPSRGGLIFYNDSATASVSVCPCTQNTIASGTPPNPAFAQPPVVGSVIGPMMGVAVINGPGSVTLGPGQSYIIDTLNCGGGWNCIANAPGGALTVMEF